MKSAGDVRQRLLLDTAAAVATSCAVNSRPPFSVRSAGYPGDVLSVLRIFVDAGKQRLRRPQPHFFGLGFPQAPSMSRGRRLWCPIPVAVTPRGQKPRYRPHEREGSRPLLSTGRRTAGCGSLGSGACLVAQSRVMSRELGCSGDWRNSQTSAAEPCTRRCRARPPAPRRTAYRLR